MEAKGDHLRNPDTDDKRNVPDVLTRNFSWDQAVPAGQLQLTATGETVECALIPTQDVGARLPNLITGRSQAPGHRPEARCQAFMRCGA